MNQSRILIIEDEVKVADSLKAGLAEHGYAAEAVYDGASAQDILGKKKFDFILLDINLPMVNGYTLCKQIRSADPAIPILMLTALGTMEDKVMGFELGADDYLVKPFEFQELLMRIKALLKRSGYNMQNAFRYYAADLTLDTEAKVAFRAGSRIDLTIKEYLLLEYLLKNKGRVVSKAELAENIWDITFDTGTNVIEVYINFLRKKIDKQHEVKLIHTLKGMGYVIKEA